MVTQGEVKIKAEGRSKRCFGQLAPVFHGCQLQQWGTLLPLQLPTSSIFPLAALFQIKWASQTFHLLWKYVFLPSQRQSDMVWFCEESNRRVQADFGEICRAVGLGEGERCPPWDVGMLLASLGMVRNSTCHSHWQWEREEKSYRVCRGMPRVRFSSKQKESSSLKACGPEGKYRPVLGGCQRCRVRGDPGRTKSQYQQRKKQKTQSSL